jgi:hypothetical protein
MCAGCPRSLAFGDLGDHKGQPSALGPFHLNIVRVPHRAGFCSMGGRPQKPTIGPRAFPSQYSWSRFYEMDLGQRAHFEAQVHSKQNQNKTHRMNALHQYLVQFQRILQKMLQFSTTLCLQNLNSQQPIHAHALSTIQRPRRNAHL